MASDEEIRVVDLGVAGPAEKSRIGRAVDNGFAVAELAISPGFRHFLLNARVTI